MSLERRAQSVNRVMRQVLIVTALPLWAASVGMMFTGHYAARITVPLSVMAMTGTVLGLWKDTDGSDGRAAARDAAELVLRAVLATRSQPAAEGLRLVTGEEAGSEPHAPERSAG